MDSYLRLKHNYLSNDTIGLTEKFDEIFNKIINKYLLFSILSLRFYHKGILYYLIKYLNETNNGVKNELLLIILSKIPKYKDKDLNRIQRFNDIDVSSTDLIFLVFYDNIKDNIKIKENILTFTLPIIKDYSFKTDPTLHGLLLNPITIPIKNKRRVEKITFIFRKNYGTIEEDVREQILKRLHKIRKKGKEITSKGFLPIKINSSSEPQHKIYNSSSNNSSSNNSSSNNSSSNYIIIYKEYNNIIFIISLIIFLIILKMFFL